jgi:putative membrane protein insertion efficiency factor
MQFVLVQLIKFYRFVISPWVGHHCRFYPTCSSYALTAIERFGALRGSYLSIIRLSKCHPWHEGGLDPVPEQFGGKHHG